MELSGHTASEYASFMMSDSKVLWSEFVWHRDVTRYLPLFENSGTFIFQLDNLLETGLDGQYAGQRTFPPCNSAAPLTSIFSYFRNIIATVEATFFASSTENPPAPRADLIVPISTLLNTTGDDASVPPGFSVSVLAEHIHLLVVTGSSFVSST